MYFIIGFFPFKDYTKEDLQMCKILREIEGLSPIQLLKKYQIDLTPPINLSELVKKIGIITYAVDFSEVEAEAGYEQGDIIGAALSDGDDMTIMYSQTCTLNRARFTIAHEIAHCCLHTNDLEINHLELRTDSNKADKERAANIFAGELLIPTEALQNTYSALIKPTVSVLSRIFQVSVSVMRERLSYLELQVFDEMGMGD